MNGEGGWRTSTQGAIGQRRLARRIRPPPADHFWAPCQAYIQYLPTSHSVKLMERPEATECRADVCGPINASETFVWRGNSGAVAKKNNIGRASVRDIQ